jgi:nucleoside-diphosphate-sugar epimerase
MKLFGRYPEENLSSVVETSSELIGALRSVNFIVVGASGFLGSWISSYLAFLQCNGFTDGTITLLARNLSSLSELSTLLQKRKSKLVSTVSLENSDFSHLSLSRTVVFFAATDTTTYGTKISDSSDSSLEIAKQTIGKLLPSDVTFIHLSSGGVYESNSRKLTGIPRDFNIRESTTDSYIYQKLSLENWCKIQNESGLFKARNPRLFSFYGPGLQLDRHYAISEFMNQAMKGLPIVIKGNPANLRTYMHPADALIQLMHQALSEEPANTQIGSAVPRTILDVGRVIAEEFSVPLQIIESNSPDTNNYVPLDVLVRKEKDFLSGIHDWKTWLNLAHSK